jgi:hypothetical protein
VSDSQSESLLNSRTVKQSSIDLMEPLDYQQLGQVIEISQESKQSSQDGVGNVIKEDKASRPYKKLFS